MDFWWRKKEENNPAEKPIDLDIIAEMVKDGVLSVSLEPYFVVVHRNHDLDDNPIFPFEFEQFYIRNDKCADDRFTIKFSGSNKVVQRVTRQEYLMFENMCKKPVDPSIECANKNMEIAINYMRNKIKAYDEQSDSVKKI